MLFSLKESHVYIKALDVYKGNVSEFIIIQHNQFLITLSLTNI